MSDAIQVAGVGRVAAALSLLWPAAQTLSDDGVGLVGYASGEFGIAETMRAHAASLEAVGMAFTIRDVQAGIASRQNDTRMHHRLSRRMPNRTNIIFVNAALTPAVFREIGRRRLRRHYNIGYWLWELEQFPDAWKAACELVDEVWVPTHFVQRAVAAATTKPVHVIPMPVQFADPGRIDLARFGIERGTHVFLSSFDFNSYPARKNPEGAIEAFRMAFPEQRRDVALLIRSINGDRHPRSMAALEAVAASDRRVRLHDGFFDRHTVLALLNSVDTFLSLHRSEGFGLHLAESMYLGKPVIATGYSGNMEFMSERNSFPVRHALRPLAAGEYPEWQGQRWAEPDLQHAAELMRRCADGSPDVDAVRERAAMDLRATCAPARNARVMLDRLRAVGVRARP